MSKKIGVAGGTPLWRRGMVSVLADGGFSVVERPDLAGWRPGRDGVAVVIACDEETIGEFRDEHTELPLVAVLSSMDLGSFAAAIRAGATVAIAEEGPLDDLVEVVAAALQGRASIPAALLASLVSRVPRTPEASAWVNEVEVSWLTALAAGTTVADIAAEAGYSEREMFRTFADLYARIGVKNRTEAIIWATRHGLLEEGE